MVPNIHEIVGVNISLMKIGTDTRTGGNGTISQHRCHIDSGMAGVKMIANLLFVVSQKTFTAITQMDLVFFSCISDEIKYRGKLFVGEL
ncbi:hypothetical protein SDC9_168358 [bioreactor metagenome]|uniref:Uncharacterized protein n=1 Tax=bioreactor metagenome TaxID=1076179 RepID=A0A645G5A7_9ZZZZ